MPAGDRLMFTARGPAGSYQVWISDGSAGGTQPIPASVFADGPIVDPVAFVDGAVYFKGWQKDTGTELYRMTLPPSFPAPHPSVEVTEYYHAGFDHYFMTADESEKARLDSGVTKGWSRTGFGFTAYAPASGAPNASPVCRFYGRPEAGLDSHFYSASAKECAEVAARFPSSWAFESSNVFEVETPAAGGGCSGTSLAPVYRAFNGRSDANHRYSIHALDQKAMQQQGWQPEGVTSAGVVMCALAVSRP
jgi:hypothetical protein